MLWISILTIVHMIQAVQCNLQKQRSVPALLFSYDWIPGLKHIIADNDFSDSIISRDNFRDITRDFMASTCNSDAYVLVNIPGLSKYDFVVFEDAWPSLKKYISQGTSGLKFEMVEPLSDNFFDDLSNYIDEQCDIFEVMHIVGNDEDTVQQYIDAKKRLIIIDYPILPNIEDKDVRLKSIMEYDDFLRTVLAQIPSPSQKVLVTSLHAGDVCLDGQYRTVKILEDLFQMVWNSDPEKNNKIMEVPRHFNKYKPKYSDLLTEPSSIWDEKFISENIKIIQLIITTLVTFLVWQFLLKSTRRNI